VSAGPVRAPHSADPSTRVARSETRQWAFLRESLAAVGAVAAATLPSRRVPLREASSDRNSSVDGPAAVRTAAHRHVRSIVIVVRAPLRSLQWVVPPPDSILMLCAAPASSRTQTGLRFASPLGNLRPEPTAHRGHSARFATLSQPLPQAPPRVMQKLPHDQGPSRPMPPGWPRALRGVFAGAGFATRARRWRLSSASCSCDQAARSTMRSCCSRISQVQL